MSSSIFPQPPSLHSVSIAACHENCGKMFYLCRTRSGASSEYEVPGGRESSALEGGTCLWAGSSLLLRQSLREDFLGLNVRGEDRRQDQDINIRLTWGCVWSPVTAAPSPAPPRRSCWTSPASCRATGRPRTGTASSWGRAWRQPRLRVSPCPQLNIFRRIKYFYCAQ